MQSRKESVSYWHYLESSEKEAIRSTKLIAKDGKRIDGRKADEIRPTFAQVGVISEAAGSAYIEMMKTKVICAIYGPNESGKRSEFSMEGKIKCSVKFAPFSCRLRDDTAQTAQENEFTLIIGQALERAICLDKLAKVKIDVDITILDNDGSGRCLKTWCIILLCLIVIVLAASVMCSSLALSSAGVEMVDLPVACTVSKCGEHYLTDPCLSEEYRTDRLFFNTTVSGMLTVAYLPTFNELISMLQLGKMTAEDVQKAIEICIDGCLRMKDLMRQCLAERHKHNNSIIR